MKNLVALFLLSLLLTGCFTTPSFESEHRKLVGTTFTLNDPWFLSSFDGTSEYDKRATHSIQSKPLTYKESITLPAGTEIRIKEINKYRNVSIGDAWVGVILEVVDPNSKSLVTVLYFWHERVWGTPPWASN